MGYKIIYLLIIIFNPNLKYFLDYNDFFMEW